MPGRFYCFNLFALRFVRILHAEHFPAANDDDNSKLSLCLLFPCFYDISYTQKE